MLSKIKNISNTEDKKRLLSNFFSLSVLQGANYLLPLITLPYLVRVLGVEYFGLLAFATATIAYFNIITDYGFNLTATREISIYREDKNKVIEIFSSVMTIKVILMFLTLLLLTILVFSFDKFSKDWLIYFLTFGTVVGQVLFPVWFFQGMERMKYITYLNIFAKSIFTVAIFIFVQEQSDFWIVPLLTSTGFIIAGIWSLVLIKKEFGVWFKWQNINTLKEYFKDGWYLFISRIAVVMYTSSNIFILGLFTNNTAVGYYSIAEKVISALLALGSIVNQAMFPYLSKIWNQNKQNYYNKFFVVLKSIVLTMSITSILLYFSAPYVIKLLFGVEMQESTNVLQILAISAIMFPLGSLFTQDFVTKKENIYVTRATIYTTLVNMLLVFILVYLFGIYGLAITVVAVQIFQVFINTKYFLFLKRKSICAQ